MNAADRAFVDEATRLAADRHNRRLWGHILENSHEAKATHAAAWRAMELPFWKWATTSNFIADREPVNFKEWPHLAPLYRAVPDDIKDVDFVVMKAAQGGASIWAMLLTLYVALKHRCQLGYFLPTKDHAMTFSNERFIRLCRDNEAIYAALGDVTQLRSVKHRVPDEGSKSIRRVLRSVIYFTYMGGVVTTESLPLDGLVFDEVQEMLLRQIETTEERLSASPIKLRVRVSTANFEGADIDYYYQRSTREEWTTKCACRGGVVLADQWDPEHGPLCIKEYNGGKVTVWVCPHCSREVQPAHGRYVPRDPENTRRRGFHFPQFVSPRQTAASILLKWRERIDTKNFYNRVLGKPFTDPKTQPISESHLAAAQDTTLRWGPLDDKSDQEGSCVMGVDQMGHLNYAVIACRYYNRMRVLHAEVIQHDDPWIRCAQLMREYRVRACAVESLPNYNEAHRFARAHDARVWVVAYADLIDQMVAWGDRPRDKVTIRKTDEEVKARYTATVDQYRMMSWALGQWTAGRVVTPDARGLVQYLRGEGGRLIPTPVWKDHWWLHLQRVALVTEEVKGREQERKLRRAVKKVGIDPHGAYAWMLLCVAWARVYGTEQLLPMDYEPEAADRFAALPAEMPEAEKGYAVQVQDKVIDADALGPRGRLAAQMAPYVRGLGGETRPDVLTCGTCTSYDAAKALCTARGFTVRDTLPGCDIYNPIPLREDRY